MMIFASKMIATVFGVGYFPVAPGTAATAVGIAAAYFLVPHPQLYLAVVLACLVLGIAVSSYLEKALNAKDPGIIVIDEVVGILIALAFVPLTWSVMISGFFLFRAFDMFKIYPINRIERLPGGWGIVLDDVVAGIYTNIVLQIALRWSGII